jgi:putative addiction module CopG family antidote
MNQPRQFTITLPDELADIVERKVQSGAYASPSEVIGESVRSLVDRDAALETWLREEVLAGHQEYLADPSAGIPAEELLARIKARAADQAP